MPSFWRTLLCGSAQPAPSAPPAYMQNTHQPTHPNQGHAPVAGRSTSVAGSRRPERMHDAVRASRTAGGASNTVDFEALLPNLVAYHCTNTYNNLIRGGVNARDSSGRTLAEVALQSGRQDAGEIVAALRSEGADLQLPDQDGNQLLHRTIMAGNLEGVQILLANGIDPNLMNTRTLPTLARYSPLPQVGDAMTGLGWKWEADDRASALHLATAFGNNPDVVRALVAAGARIHLTNPNGNTALHWAASFCSNADIIDALMESGADIAVTTPTNATPLHRAASRNPSLAVLDRLIKHGADIDALDATGRTALSKACENPAQSEVVRALIHHGASLMKSGTNENLPLHVARDFSQKLEIAHSLRRGGLDLVAEGIEPHIINCINAGYVTNAGAIRALIDGGMLAGCEDELCQAFQMIHETFLNMKMLNIMLSSSSAARSIVGDWNRGEPPIAPTLVALRRQPSAPPRDENAQVLSTWRDCQPGTNFTRLMRNRGGIDRCDANGKTLVEVALESNQSQAGTMVAALKAEGADLALVDANQNHLLHRLILANNVAGARILIANRVNLNALNRCNSQVVGQYTAALQTAGIARPLNWIWTAEDTATPLHLASAFSNDPILIGELIAAGARVDQTNGNQATPLHWACAFANDARVVDALVAGGANISIDQPELGTAFEYAAVSNSNPDILRTMITHGAEIERIGNKGFAPLHWAAMSPSQAGVVRTLIELGANRLTLSSDQNNDQNSPLQLAVKVSTQIEIAKILSNGGMDLRTIGCRPLERQSVAAGYADMTEVIHALHDGITHQSAQNDANLALAIRQVESDIGVGARLILREDNPAATQLVRSQLNARTSRTLAVLRGLQAAQRLLPAAVALRPPEPHCAPSSAPPRATRATITDLDEMERLDFALAQSLQLEEEEQARQLAAARADARRAALPATDSGSSQRNLQRPSAPPAPGNNASDTSHTLQSASSTAPRIQPQQPIVNPLYLAEPLVQAIEQWYQTAQGHGAAAERAPRVDAWHAIGSEEHADAFQAFLQRLPETAEYVNEVCRPAFKERIRDLLDTLQATPALRTTAFDLVFESTSSCGDRVALALNSIEMARINHDAEQGRYTASELITLRTGMFRLQILEELAHQKITALRNQTELVLDEVEVVLGFQVLLAEEMNLPGVSRSMRYQRSSNITSADLQQARERIAQREQRNEYVKFIAEWQPWQTQLRRLRPTDFAALEQRVAAERGAVTEQPSYTSDNDYVSLCRELENMQRTRLTFSLESWTREWLVQNRSHAT